MLLLNECLLLFISLWLSPETFGYTLVLTEDFIFPGTYRRVLSVPLNHGCQPFI